MNRRGCMRIQSVSRSAAASLISTLSWGLLVILELSLLDDERVVGEHAQPELCRRRRIGVQLDGGRPIRFGVRIDKLATNDDLTVARDHCL